MPTFGKIFSMTENKRGGKREGSGRKPKDPTTTINFRVPVDKAGYLKPLVSTYIKELLNNTPVETNPKSSAKTKVKLVKSEPKKKFNLAEELERIRKEK